MVTIQNTGEVHCVPAAFPSRLLAHSTGLLFRGCGLRELGRQEPLVLGLHMPKTIYDAKIHYQMN